MAHEPHVMRPGAGVGALAMRATVVAPRAMAPWPRAARRAAVVAGHSRRPPGLLVRRFLAELAGAAVDDCARSQLLGFILQIHAQLREFELDLVNGEALAALQ